MTADFTPSSARAFCTILDVFRVMVREMTLRHFFPSLLPLFNASSDTPPSGTCKLKSETISRNKSRGVLQQTFKRAQSNPSS